MDYNELILENVKIGDKEKLWDIIKLVLRRKLLKSKDMLKETKKEIDSENFIGSAN